MEIPREQVGSLEVSLRAQSATQLEGCPVELIPDTQKSLQKHQEAQYIDREYEYVEVEVEDELDDK